MTGPTGTQGPPGVQGPAGAQGASTPVGLWVPADQGLVAWSMDPLWTYDTVAPANGLTVVRVMVRAAMRVTSVVQYATTAAGTSIGSNYAGLYSTAGALLAASADQGATWAGVTGRISTPIPATDLTPGHYYAAFIFTFSPGPVWPAVTFYGVAVPTMNLGAGQVRMSAAVAASSLPGTLPALTSSLKVPWVGLGGTYT